MKNISILEITIKDFKSFSNEDISFPDTIGLKLLSGDNKVERRLGANGAGKSSLWEAVCFALYGVGVKGAKLSSLLAWGKTTTKVEIYIKIGEDVHEIIRTGPPMKIYLDTKVVTQEKIDELIGLTKERFLHSVLFGQGVPLFPDLSIPERGILLDSVLNLDIWETAADQASKKVNSLEKDLATKKTEISFVEGKLSGLQTEEYVQAQIEYWEVTHQEEIDKATKDVDTWQVSHQSRLDETEKQRVAWREQQIKLVEDETNNLEALERFMEKTGDLIKELSQDPPIDTSELEKTIKDAEKDLSKYTKKQTEFETEKKLASKPKEFWEANNSCPTCYQPITPDEKEKHLCKIKDSVAEIELNLSCLAPNIKKIENDLDMYRKNLAFLHSAISLRSEQIRTYERDQKRLNVEINSSERLANKLLESVNNGSNPYIKQLERAEIEINPYIGLLEKLQKKTNPNIDLLGSLKKERQTLEKKKKTSLEESKQVESSILAAEYWKHGFKRIRLYFVQQVLAALQIEIQSAISALGLEGWKVNLATESETKSGTTKLGVQLHIKSPVSEGPWESWSGGEAQRLRLSIAMGLSSLIQRSAGSWFNLEIYDEPTASLSGQGVEDLLEALRYRAESQKKAIWLTDHSALTYSGFKEIWLVTKEAKGSKVYLLNEAEV